MNGTRTGDLLTPTQCGVATSPRANFSRHVNVQPKPALAEHVLIREQNDARFTHLTLRSRQLQATVSNTRLSVGRPAICCINE